MWTAKFKIRFTGDVKMKLKHEGVLLKDGWFAGCLVKSTLRSQVFNFSTLRFSSSLDQIIIRLCLMPQINLIEERILNLVLAEFSD